VTDVKHSQSRAVGVFLGRFQWISWKYLRGYNDHSLQDPSLFITFERSHIPL